MTLTIDPEFRALIPPLTSEERAQLEANLIADGCRDPLVTWHGAILDGHNRHDICQARGIAFRTVEACCADRDAAKVWIIRNQFGRRNLQPFQRAELALRLEPLIAVRAKASYEANVGRPKSSSSLSAIPADEVPRVDTRRELSHASGLSEGTIHKARVIAAKAPEPVKEQLRRGEVSIDRAYQDIRGQERRAERVERLNALASGNAPLAPPQRYPVLYADPPWQYEHVKTDNRSLDNQYPTMALDEICALPVADAVTPDAILFLWATSPKLAEAMRVLNAWGFTYRTSMVWVKDQIGMGYYARQQHEFLLIATKGEPPVPLPEARPASVVNAPRTAHSAKPPIFAELIERMYPDLPKAELFAREARAGWWAWGNQVA